MITVFDIETHQIPEVEWEKLIPEKIGNITDPVKVREKFKEKLALHAKTAYIACIGYLDPSAMAIETVKEYSEEELIKNFYSCLPALSKTHFLVGHNCFNFDLPFIVQRGLINGIKPPDNLRNHRYWNDNIKDTQQEWTCGVYGEMISLKDLAIILQCGEKNESGKNFPELWDTDPDKAIEYLKNDLELTYSVAKKMFL